jgi:rubrerythrin
MGNEVKSKEAKQKAQNATSNQQNVKRNSQSEKQKFVCDSCGFEMYKSNCKIICPNCGSRYDCSDLNIYFD